jgi:hypothetical protein
MPGAFASWGLFVDPDDESDASRLVCTELPPYAQVFTLRQGKLINWCTFPDQESSLKAVGPEE